MIVKVFSDYSAFTFFTKHICKLVANAFIVLVFTIFKLYNFTSDNNIRGSLKLL